MTQFARVVHAAPVTVPSGPVPHRCGRGTAAATHPIDLHPSGVGGGTDLAGDAHYRKAWDSRNAAEMQLPGQPTTARRNP